MGKQTKTEWKCDLCGETKLMEGNKVPKGWAPISIPDKYTDRAWIEKAVCDGCCGMIDVARTKKEAGR